MHVRMTTDRDFKRCLLGTLKVGLYGDDWSRGHLKRKGEGGKREQLALWSEGRVF